MEDYEKKYKEAMARMESWARGEHPECFSEAQKAAEFVFPELKIDDDERIRKSLLTKFIEEKNRGAKYAIHGVSIDDVIGWLEKQKPIELDKNAEIRFRSILNLIDNGCPIEKSYIDFIKSVYAMLMELQQQKKLGEKDWLEKRGQLKSVNSLDALNWKPASENPTAHWEHNNSISPLYLVKCEGNQEGKPIIGYARYSFATDRWMDCIHTTGDGIYKVIEWLDDGVEDKATIEDNPKFRVGDTIKPKDGGHEPWEVKEVDMVGKKYRFNDGYVVDFSHEDAYELADETCKCGEENERLVLSR